MSDPRTGDHSDGSGRAYAPRARVPSTPLDRRRRLPPLDVTATLDGKSLLVVGGTGFLGKVLISMLLHQFPVKHIYLMVRGKGGLTPRDRFEQEVWPTPCLDPLRQRYAPDGKDGKEDLYTRITPIPGDVSEPFAGVKDQWLVTLQNAPIDAVLNVAGVVSFDPPLDEGLGVNALGLENMMALCRALRPGTTDPAQAVPLLHTSTCFVAGGHTGTIWEDDPRDFPFPKADVLDRSHWDPQREVREGMAVAAHVRARAEDAQMRSQFADRAKAKLREHNRPTTGEPLAQAIAKEKKKFIDDELGDLGMKRAAHWGWPNTYTYTKAIGEQLLAGSGQPYTIVRPAVVESSWRFPFPGWNEGINTSAPLIYLAMLGHLRYPTREGNVLDVIPVDTVCAGTILSTAALLRGEQAKVYQYGSSDTNPLTMARLTELTALYKRSYMRSRTRGNPLMNRVYARFGVVNVTPETYNRISAPAIAKGLTAVTDGLSLLNKTPAAGLAKSVKKSIEPVIKQAKTVDMLLQTFMPFTAEYNYAFRCDNTRAEYARLVEHDRALLPFDIETLDWRDYVIDVHIRGLRKWVFPHLEAKLMKRPRAEERYSDLLAFLDEVTEREGSAVCVQRLIDAPRGGRSLVGVTYRDLRRRAHACAARLADVGVHPGARVALVAKNSPEWAIGFFGILACGAAVVPLDPSLDALELARRMKQVGAEFALVGDDANAPDGAACLDLTELTEAPPHEGRVEPPEVLVTPSDVAVIAYTAGTTGTSKPVVLTHKNVTAVLASVAPLFKLTRRDSGLSVLPLFHTFELTCGLLLPMLRGARVTYVDEVTADALADAFSVAGITAMIGVPQVWEDLEEKIAQQLQDSGPFAEAAFQAGLLVNRTLGKALGVNLGRVIFRPIHDRLGGKIRFLVSTGGPVPKKTAETFKALGIELKQGYGLTEAAPVVAVGSPNRGAEPVPGLEVEIRDVQGDGVGEVVVRGDAVMAGYLDDEELTAQALGPDGWLRTGDLGRVDKEGRLTLVARNHEVITLASGHRVYPRAIEETLKEVKGVDDVAVVGVPDGQGGERVAALVVVRAGEDIAVVERAVAWAARKLDERERPSIIEARREALPRTADRKVRRPEVIAAIVAIDAQRAVNAAQALSPAEVIDLPERSSRKRTDDRLPAPGQKKATPHKDAPVEVPQVLQGLVKGVLGAGQREFYQRVMKSDVEGEQNIPWDRPTIVVANHASHLDMGLIKVALGAYGKDIVALAAKDYFFEGKWRRTYFENFTNLKPLDRGDNPREAMREASALLEQGRTVLLFPEGTRTSNGELAPFRPAVAYLALRHGVDVLPLYVDGTYRSMPRGAFMPKNRRVGVRIGEAIPAATLKAATDAAGLRMSAACQKTALVIQRAVEALRDERGFDLQRNLDELVLGKVAVNGAHANGANGNGNGNGASGGLHALFADLEKRFQKDEVKEPATFYFSLGDSKDSKWTVQVTKDGCLIVNDKLDGKADCVFKTDVKMFTRIVREHYIPDVSEFLDGTVKTNNPELLTTFVTVFNL